MTDRTYSTKEIADHFNLKVPTIRNWVVEGCPCQRFGHGKPIKFKLDEVKEWRRKASTLGADLDPQREKALLDRERRLKVTTERLVLQGKLVPTNAVEEHWSNLVGAARAKLLALPHKIAPVVVSCESLREVEDEARQLITEALEELASSGVPDMDATPGLDGESVVGQVQEAKSGELSGAGAVEDVESGISEGNT